MRTRPAIFLFLSVGLNVLLATYYLMPPQKSQTSEAPAAEPVSTVSSTGKTKLHVVVRKQFFSWSEIESDDYPTYISNLKAIGCPEPTIRDIIVADVNQLYAQKGIKDPPLAGPKWWRAFPDAATLQAAIERKNQLDIERTELLDRLLGNNWAPLPEPPVARPDQLDLDGPLLGLLPAIIKEALLEITTQAQFRKQALLDEQKKSRNPINPADLLQLSRETMEDLAHLLTAAQLEEYSLRYSDTAKRIRQDTACFDATADEIRKIYMARAEFDQQIDSLAFATDPALIKKRVELEQQREEAIKQSLGGDRYRLYLISQEPAFREAQILGKQIGAPPKTILSLYELNQLATQEQVRIKNDMNLTGDEREHALLQLQLDRDKSTREILDNNTALTKDTNQEEPPMPPMPPMPQAP